MMTITHTLFGSVAGGIVSNPVVAFSLGVLIHLLVDKVKHYWPYARSKNLFLMLSDWPIAVALLIHFLYSGEYSMFWGGFGGMMVDFVAINIPAVQNSRIAKWHTNRQPHSKDPKYLLVDAAMIVPLIIILVFFL